jgi:hypothetical protein
MCLCTIQLATISILVGDLRPEIAAAQTTTVQTTAVSSDPIASIWWVPIVSAAIGAFSALATPFVKDIYIQRRNEKVSRTESQHAIFRNYAAPLLLSSDKLLWRLSEIFIDKNGQWLKTSTLPFVYSDYKRKSTLYRIACVLGWIRAINLELSALPRGGTGFGGPIYDAIKTVQSSLADGRDVELLRLSQLCDVWRYKLDTISSENLSMMATKLELKLYEIAGDDLKHDTNFLVNLGEARKQKICLEISQFLSAQLRLKQRSDDLVFETMHQAIAAMSHREALIYRDWQDAIGDSMLEVDKDSIRRYKLIGYKQFDELLNNNTIWMEVFGNSISDIDYDAVDTNDFRAKQLKGLATAIAEIIISFSRSEEKDLVDKSSLATAERLKAVVRP